MATLGRYASLTLARFSELRPPGDVTGDALFLNVGTDVRAANTSAFDPHGFKFVVYGIHEVEAAARAAHSSREALAPWLADADEVWSGVLQPFRHFGAANFLAQNEPGPLYDCPPQSASPDGPIVILTTVGWSNTDNKERIAEFGAGVTAVRISMTAVDGLHSQQTFSFPGALDWDGLTVTFWRDQAAAMAWAYGGGLHRNELNSERESPRSDRSSFTRFRVIESSGTWHGGNPLEFGVR